eukprot:CAMPEP_0201575654 /NCGR_PEP_ID=MMETSP0190_2-20130828/20991_1 /ASSEMBLY_ACC=CAM_ASM_000263 /TAXON_ID=37353 /ORGANISM="Rosalina sp." /LENGTH=351 /DNA_ID=CAMNT_0048005549 /DNA_START=26 /DNA_END=1077 /DNA_ORIENTATION=-
MAVIDWLWIPLAIVFIVVFLGSVGTAAGSLFELYGPSRKPRRAKSKAKSKPSSRNEEPANGPNGMPFIPSKIKPIKEEASYNEEEKKDYEQEPLIQGSISPLPSNVTDEETKQSQSFDIASKPQSQLSQESAQGMNKNTGSNINANMDQNSHSSSNSNSNSTKNEINKQYYNGSKNNEEDTTLTLTYYLELQSRLQHLESLINSDSFQSVDPNDYINKGDNEEETKREEAPRDMISEIHGNNMKMIEGMIQNVIHDKSAHRVKEQEYDFYNRLNDDDGAGRGNGFGPKPSGNRGSQDYSGDHDSNWSKPQAKRRPSIDQQISQTMNYSFNAMMGTAMKLMQNPNTVGLVTS